MVGIYIRGHGIEGILMCGGTGTDDDHDARNCFVWSKTNGYKWERRPELTLNTGRVQSNLERIGDEIHIIGGLSSNPFHGDYERTEEILDLDNIAKGWQIKNLFPW